MNRKQHNMTVDALKSAAPDKDIEPPYTPERGSLAWRLDQLEIGACVSESVRIGSEELPLTGTKDTLDRLSSVISSSVNRLQQRVNKRFTSERGKWLTSSDDVICTIAVTRVE
jgi:hypothetical protein